jgi:trimeric autotransporter adhesin
MAERSNFMNSLSRFFARQFLLGTALSLLVLFSSALSQAQITPLGDAYTNSADPTTNYGANVLLYVDGAKEITYIQFDLASIPAGASVSQATLKLYVNGVTTAGSFNVDYVTGSWAESTIDGSNAPPLGSAIASNVSVTSADKNQYILMNATSAVQAWLSGSETNNGIALVANSTFNASFDSKENTTTSHPPELDIVFAPGSGGGTITGVTAGTGLTGGGTSGNVTLNLNTTEVALLAASNTFTGNQTVNGNLSASGVVTGSAFQIGSNLVAYGSLSTGNAFLGFAGNTTMTGELNTGVGGSALQTNTSGFDNTAVGVGALYSNTTGSYNTAVGAGTLGSTTGSSQTGNYNTATGNGALAGNTTGSANTAIGYQALNTLGPSGPTGTGSNNTAIGYQALAANSGSFTTATGSQALLSSNATGPNDAFGYQALYSNTTGLGNAAFGYQTLDGNTSGNYNTASGYRALFSNSNGQYNAASGYQALSANTTGEYNVALGAFTLDSNTIGNNNTAVANDTGFTNDGSSLTGSNNTFLGAGAGMSTGSLNVATAIGSCALVSANFALVLGAPAGANNNQCGDVASNTNVGIDVGNPTHILTVLQGGGNAIADGWATYSSRRWKTNIQPLHNALSKVEQLRGVSYDLKDSGKHEIGVIAEEVGAVIPEIVSWEKNGKDAQGVDYSRLTALLIEATKEQQALIRKQQAEIGAQQSQIRSQQAQLKAQQAKSKLQEAQMAELMLQVNAIRATLETKSHAGSEVRTIKAQVPMVQQ